MYILWPKVQSASRSLDQVLLYSLTNQSLPSYQYLNSNSNTILEYFTYLDPTSPYISVSYHRKQSLARTKPMKFMISVQTSLVCWIQVTFVAVTH